MKTISTITLLKYLAGTSLNTLNHTCRQSIGSRKINSSYEEFQNKSLAGFFFSKVQARLISMAAMAILLCLLLFHSPAYAQKIENKKVWTTYHKLPAVALQPKYSSYTIEYDFGDMAVPTGERPPLQGLEYKKGDADLLLKITVKNVYSSEKELKQESIGGKQKGYYDVAYKADYGYELTEKATGNNISSYKRKGGVFSTEAFTTKTELDMYFKNAFVSDLTKALVEKVNQRIAFDLSENKYEIRVEGNTLEGSSAAYQEINKATNEYITLVSSNSFQKDKIRPLTAVWESNLQKINWEDKKTEMNKKVANALIENLCGAYLLLEDYDKLKEVTALSESKNKGLLSDMTAPAFEVDPTFPGPKSNRHMILRDKKLFHCHTARYGELALDLTSK